MCAESVQFTFIRAGDRLAGTLYLPPGAPAGSFDVSGLVVLALPIRMGRPGLLRKGLVL